MSSRPHRTSSHSASRPRSTASGPSSYFAAFTSAASPKSRGFGSGSTSAYRRSPRPNFLVRAWERIRKLVRRFVRYARKNPLQVVAALAVALVGGGALTGLLRRAGGLEALGLGGLARNLDVNKIVGMGHGLRTASGGFPSFDRELDSIGGRGSDGGFDPWAMGKGALKIASAFL